MLTFRWTYGARAGSLAMAALLGIACGKPAEAPPAGEQPTPSAEAGVVAQVGDRKITLEEVDRHAATINRRPFQDIYDLRQQILEQMVAQQLVTQEAAQQGVTPEALLNDALSGKVRSATDAEVQAFYNQNLPRMGGKSLEEIGPQIRTFLDEQQRTVAQQQFLRQLKEKAGAKTFLEPPRAQVEVAANDPSIGPPSAKVTIVEFSDFECPFCQRVGPTLSRLRETYGEDVRIVFRDYPLPSHPQAQLAAEAAQCANAQGKFWEYHDHLFANQGALAAEDLKRHAGQLGLDGQDFTVCLDSGRFRSDVQADYQHGQTLGVSGTPAFFINGRFLNGAQPFETFKEIVDEELRN